MRRITIILLAVYGLITIFSCANRGIGPQGGPKDATPPQVVKYSPADGCTNMTKSHIEITFDEIVTLDNPYQKVIVSPPQKTPAEIKAISHKVVVNFIDSLIDSTTYTIDFTDAIQDNNEANKLKDFSYSFSTGDHIDTLQISGKVIEAENHNPVDNIIIGVQSNLDDTAFTTLPFRRITKTNAEGAFTVRNLAAGSYHIFALQDMGSNYMYDMPNEKIAFLDTVLTPICHADIRRDTIYNPEDSTMIDTVITHTKRHFEPKNILLQAFVEPDLRQYLIKSERKERHKIDLYFNLPMDSTPVLHPLNFADSLFNPQVSFSINRDTLTYWLPDTALWAIDTLQFALHSDTVVDTLQMVYRAAKKPMNKTNGSMNGDKSKKEKNGRKGEEQTPKATPKLAVASNASQTFDVYKPLEIKFDMPTKMNNQYSYRLEIKKDTLWVEAKKVGKITQVDTAGTRFKFEHEWLADTTYRLVMDSGLFTNMVGLTSGKETLSLKTKKLEEYSKLILHLKNFKGNEVVQLIDKDEKVIREMKVSGADMTFEYITPGVYYMKLFRDENGDGKWSPGKYSEHRQAEAVFYFPFDIELRAFWDVEEDWDPESMPLLKQKPKELIKTSEKK